MQGKFVPRAGSVKPIFAAARRPAMAALCCALLAGCSMTGRGVDDVLTTGSISMAEATPSIAVDPFEPRAGADAGATDRLIDEDTIRLAVTAADPDRLVDGALPWASAATGSNGEITDIAEMEIAGQTCRRFSATRNAYDGASLYRGEVCLDRRSGWWTRSLRRAGAERAG
ncbi:MULTISPECIES: RT0821/Lpp0805 family surface protein [unclassified Roseitalea]|uniref:RT0821/Lpp0805 family surface protein n=1 Tax=unclassified Roseitalea TaxID=2639107 RepID=UPI00273CFD73|nr:MULTISPECIES: RT0821/Lpp0805 family surface protein [unclassified Roseitalea]